MSTLCVTDYFLLFRFIHRLKRYKRIIFDSEIYCGIIIDRRGLMFVGNPCPRIYTPTNLYTSFVIKHLLELSRLQYQRNYVPTNQENFATHEHLPPVIKKIPQYF